MSHEQAASLFSASHSVSMSVSESGEISLGMKFTPIGNMLEMEEAVLAAVNAFGAALTEHCLVLYDADGSRLQIGKTTYCSCGQFPQTYKTPYGDVNVMRYAYQSAEGGGRYVPLERKAHMVLNSTPRFAKTAASKMADMPSTSVQTDLFDNHDVSVSRDYLTKLSDKVGESVKSSEPFIKYDDAKDLNKDEIKTISVSLDGTALLLKDKDKKPAFREAMAGVVSLIDKDGGRRSTVYVGEAPEYGKETFSERLELELAGAESLFPDAAVQGIADGAAHNWAWLTPRTDVQVLDFYHMSTYVCKASDILFPKKISDRDEWTETWLHKIKYSNNGVDLLIDELEERRQALKKPSAEELEKVLVYLRNQKDRTHCRRERANNRPIGSGVTEAACKTLIKQRMCCSGMRWSKDGASNIIGIRSLILSNNRWSQFWNHYMTRGGI